MQPHQERVVAEKNDLGEKLRKLKSFIAENPSFKTLTGDEQDRLNRQYEAMCQYYKILTERITAFGFAPPIGAIGGFFERP